MKLLTVGNAKTSRGESLGILTGILHLNPHADERLCPYASTECKLNCLVKSGRAEFMPAITVARTKKTREFYENRQAFVEQLRKDIKALAKRAAKLGMVPAVRLNGTSDILWEKLTSLMVDFPEVQFYDYTKVPLRYRGKLANYHLTFSYSGDNWDDCLEAISRGINIAVVFAGNMPSEWRGLEVIDGTVHDVRFIDSIKGGVVGLCPKGRTAKLAAKSNSKFIVKA